MVNKAICRVYLIFQQTSASSFSRLMIIRLFGKNTPKRRIGSYRLMHQAYRPACHGALCFLDNRFACCSSGCVSNMSSVKVMVHDSTIRSSQVTKKDWRRAIAVSHHHHYPALLPRYHHHPSYGSASWLFHFCPSYILTEAICSFRSKNFFTSI